VGFHTKTSINFAVRSDLNAPNLENLCIEIRKPNSRPFLIATWYKPPWPLLIYLYIYLTVILRGRAGYELIYQVIISSYPASPRRITVLVNFQAILLIFSGETSSNRDIFFTEDAAKIFFPTSKISAQEIRNQFFLIKFLVKLNDIDSYRGLREPIRKLENHYPELKIY